MTRFVTALLIWMMAVMPSAGPLMPHAMVKNLHVMNEAHHVGDGHDHGDSHDHGEGATGSHTPQYDALVYFEDYLHVDVKNPPQQSFVQALPAQPVQVAMLVEPVQPLPHLSLPSRPPAWQAAPPRPRSVPLYLSTQRIRV